MTINDTGNSKAKNTVEKENLSQVMVIKRYHTHNWVLNAFYFMKDLLKKHKNIRFSVAGDSH